VTTTIGPAPAFCNAAPQASAVAPVVYTSSTRTTGPETAARRRTRGQVVTAGDRVETALRLAATRPQEGVSAQLETPRVRQPRREGARPVDAAPAGATRIRGNGHHGGGGLGWVRSLAQDRVRGHRGQVEAVILPAAEQGGGRSTVGHGGPGASVAVPA